MLEVQESWGSAFRVVGTKWLRQGAVCAAAGAFPAKQDSGSSGDAFSAPKVGNPIHVSGS